MSRQKKLTQKRLKELLHYDPETGIFIRKVALSNRVKVGDVAGTCSHGYVQICVDGIQYRAHRLAILYMTGSFPKLGYEIDHNNRIRNDNCWDNLCEATHSFNNRNKPLQSNNTSGIPGVSWSKRVGLWAAYIKIHTKRIDLGGFETKFDAVRARLKAEKQLNWTKGLFATEAEKYFRSYLKEKATVR